jgi:hypothetical protein
MEINGMTVLWIDTYCLNPDKASDDTYSNWVTVATTKQGALFRRSNVEGAGVGWDYFGRVDIEGYTMRDAKTTPARLVATIQSRLADMASNAGSFGGAYCKATVLQACVNTQTGRVLTSAPSILNGAPTRDKNRNLAREATATVTMGCGGKCKLDEDCIHCD